MGQGNAGYRQHLRGAPHGARGQAGVRRQGRVPVVNQKAELSSEGEEGVRQSKTLNEGYVL